MIKISTCLLIAFFTFNGFLSLKACPTIISSQGQFEEALDRINNGEKVYIKLKKGNYIIKKNVVASESVRITGDNAIISFSPLVFRADSHNKETSTHYMIILKTPISLFPFFYNKDWEQIAISESVLEEEEVNYVNGIIEAPSIYEPGTTIKIPISDNLNHLKNKTFSEAYGYIDCGWRVVNFRLLHSDKNFFYCSTLNNCDTRNYMYDKSVYKKPVRFVIYNAELKPDRIFYRDNELYIPKSIDKVFCLTTKDFGGWSPSLIFNSDVELEGINFIGFADIKINSKRQNKCEISNCTFRNSVGDALSITKEGGDRAEVAQIKNCKFESCAVQTGYILRLTSDFTGNTSIKIDNCIFSRYPNDFAIYKNTFGVIKIHGDVEIANSIIYNTCRDHIYCRGGIIKINNNFFYNTDTFNSKGERNFSSDWGQVYCSGFMNTTVEAMSNKESRIFINNNLFYGAYAYGGDARGIFIDDGRGDVECNNNIILNAQVYSIDSRNVKKHEASSVRNIYNGNYVSTRYRLVAGAAVSGQDMPIVKDNVLIGTSINNVISNTLVTGDDIKNEFNPDFSLKGSTIEVSNDLYNKLKESKSWRVLKRYLREKK